MEGFRVIEFPRRREFSEKVNATFEFLRQNFRALGKCILFIAGPPVLVGSLMMGSFMGEFMNLSQSFQFNPENSNALTEYFMTSSFWIQLSLMFVFLLISFVVSIATINTYLVIYVEKKSNRIEVNEVWERVRSLFLPYLGSSILFFILFMVAYFILILPVIILGAISGFLVVFGVLGLIAGLFYIVFGSSLTYFIQTYEKKGFFESLARSFRLVNGKWWSTFGLVFILWFIMLIASYISLIPYYAMVIPAELHKLSSKVIEEPSITTTILTTLFFTFYYLVQMLLYALPNIGIAFQYFNLVELKEAKGLLNKIENLGAPPTLTGPPSGPEETY